MRDERLVWVEDLFQRAWNLEHDLGQLLERVPEPDMPITAPLPPEWTELRSYAECARLLHEEIHQGLRRIDREEVFRRLRPRDSVWTPRDDRRERTTAVFHKAHRLLADLKGLQEQLPEPGIAATGKLPSDWSEFHAYAVFASILQTAISFGLYKAVTGAIFRNEFDVLRTISPPAA